MIKCQTVNNEGNGTDEVKANKSAEDVANDFLHSLNFVPLYTYSRNVEILLRSNHPPGAEPLEDLVKNGHE